MPQRGQARRRGPVAVQPRQRGVVASIFRLSRLQSTFDVPEAWTVTDVVERGTEQDAELTTATCLIVWCKKSHTRRMSDCYLSRLN